MKFCDRAIQDHLLNGGKIRRRLVACDIVLHITEQGYVANKQYNFYTLNVEDLTSDDWEIVEPK